MRPETRFVLIGQLVASYFVRLNAKILTEHLTVMPGVSPTTCRHMLILPYPGRDNEWWESRDNSELVTKTLREFVSRQ